MQHKKCTHCQETKHTDEYYQYRGTPESMCSECRKAKTRTRTIINKGIVAEAKYKPCHCCGKILAPSLIDLHHLDPTQKEVDVARAIHARSPERLREEISKCVPVCRPCHREIHYGN